MKTSSVNTFIVRLHHYARLIPIVHFQDWALECVKELIAFDSAMWCTGRDAPAAIHTAHLYQQPREMADTYVNGGFQESDPLHARAWANPGITVNLADLMPRLDFEQISFYTSFAHPFGLEAALCTVQIEPPSTLGACISLWRSDPRSQFKEAERQRKELLMPHLIEAQHANRLWHFQEERARLADGWAEYGLAICDRYGLLHDANRQFSTLLAAEWPGWSGARLPRALAQALRDGAFEGKRIKVDRAGLEDAWMLIARRLPFGGRLGRREREVASLFAMGHSAIEIARTLKLSSTTVRNQISRSYKKLGVSNKAELARRLGDLNHSA